MLYSVAPRQRGRSLRAHNSPLGCAASACSSISLRTISKPNACSQHSARSWRDWGSICYSWRGAGCVGRLSPVGRYSCPDARHQNGRGLAHRGPLTLPYSSARKIFILRDLLVAEKAVARHDPNNEASGVSSTDQGGGKRRGFCHARYLELADPLPLSDNLI